MISVRADDLCLRVERIGVVKSEIFNCDRFAAVNDNREQLAVTDELRALAVDCDIALANERQGDGLFSGVVIRNKVVLDIRAVRVQIEFAAAEL